MNQLNSKCKTNGAQAKIRRLAPRAVSQREFSGFEFRAERKFH